MLTIALQNGGSSTGLVTNFVSAKSSADFSRMYKSDGLRGGHVVLLDRTQETRAAAKSALAAYPGGLQVGGGVTADNANSYLEAGASHVIVTSYVFRDGKLDNERLCALEDAVGTSRLVLDLSCRSKADGKYYVVTDRWQKFTNMEVAEDVLKSLGTRCDEFLIHGVDVEGMRCGIMEDLVSKLGEWSPVPVTYAGGARDLGDFERVKAIGGGRVDLTVGSALDVFGDRCRMLMLWRGIARTTIECCIYTFIQLYSF